MGETVSERGDRYIVAVAGYSWNKALQQHGHVGATEFTREGASAANRAEAAAAIRAAFERAAQADLLDRALALLIARHVDAGDCPDILCPYDSVDNPEDSVCAGCWCDWTLAESARQAKDGEQ